MTLRSAEAHYTQQAALAELVRRRADQLWSQVSADDINAWADLVPQVVSLVTAGQYRAASAAEEYVATALSEQGADVAAEARVARAGFAGMANSEVPVVDLLDLPRVQALEAIGAGAAPSVALAAAGKRLQTYAVSLVQDAGRQADSVATFARPRVGWVRMVNPPCCGRCAILAGKWFRSNQGFLRHPRCDCRHIPAPEDAAGEVGTDPAALFASGQVKAPKAALRAIEDGADPAQVINARRGAPGMAPAGARLTKAEQRMLRGGRDRGQLERTDVFGRQLFTTTEGTTRRGIAGQRLAERGGYAIEDAGQVLRNTRSGQRLRDATRRRARAPRLLPESIYEIAEDREDAIRLLKLNGYIL